MNRMAEIAKMFDLEIGEEFKFVENCRKSQSTYKFTEDGLYYIEKGYCVSNPLMHMLTGRLQVVKLTKKWKPKYDEPYYIPSFSFGGYSNYFWCDGINDNIWYDIGIVCKTKEEAVEMAKKMLNAIKEDGV